MVDSTVGNGIVSTTIELELESIDRLRMLFNNDELVGAYIELGPDVHAKLMHVQSGVGFLNSIDVTLVLSFPIGVASGIVANLVYGAIGPRIRRIAFGGRRIRPNEEALVEALQTAIDLVKEQQKQDDQ